MKMKKIIASIATIAMAASAMSVNASALTEGAASIDFEDGDYSFVYMNNDDPKGAAGGGSDDSILSVETYDGSKQLKVDVQNCKNVPKVWFDMDKIMPRSSAITVNQIEFDVTFVPKNMSEDEPVQLGWMGGSVGVAGGFDMNLPGKGQVNPSWSDGSWSATSNGCYEDNGIAKEHIVRKMLLPTQMWSEEGINPFFGFMTWANQNGTEYVMYIDNVVFKSKSGTVNVGIPAVVETEAPAETEAAVTEAAPAETEAPATEAPAETEAAPAETEAVVEEEVIVEEVIEEAPVVEETAAPVVEEAPAPAPAPVADATTPVTNTGNTAAATVLAVMAVAGAAAVATRKRK